MKISSLLGLAVVLANSVGAQTTPETSFEKVRQKVLHLDSLFWQTYNSCDVDGMATFFTDDLEFYHDKGGLTTTSANLVALTKKGMCANDTWRLRREAVDGSLQVFPLDNYGAILSGEHVFYILEKGKSERLDGHAKFTHVWRYQDNAWKMHRVLSYDHRPALRKNDKKEIILSDALLKKYEGRYEGPKTGVITITKANKSLKMEAGSFQSYIYPESENFFFHKARDLQFEFICNDHGAVMELMVRENGTIVEKAKRVR